MSSYILIISTVTVPQIQQLNIDVFQIFIAAPGIQE
jgi:hypothetical protein